MKRVFCALWIYVNKILKSLSQGLYIVWKRKEQEQRKLISFETEKKYHYRRIHWFIWEKPNKYQLLPPSGMGLCPLLFNAPTAHRYKYAMCIYWQRPRPCMLVNPGLTPTLGHPLLPPYSRSDSQGDRYGRGPSLSHDRTLAPWGPWRQGSIWPLPGGQADPTWPIPSCPGPDTDWPLITLSIQPTGTWPCSTSPTDHSWLHTKAVQEAIHVAM